MSRFHTTLMIALLAFCTAVPFAGADKPDKPSATQTLYDGTGLGHFDFAPESWYIDDDGALTCRMKEITLKNGKKKTRGRGDIFSKKTYGNFMLTLSYKLSEGANSGVFYRCDPKNPVQGGFEIQLMDNEGFQKTHGKKDARKLNGSFYDAQAPTSDPSNPPGEWNSLTLKCDGPHISLKINGTQTFAVNVNDWNTPRKNPDGTSNKFKTALKDLPRVGHIGFQNHGQKVWFKDVKITPIK